MRNVKTKIGDQVQVREYTLNKVTYGIISIKLQSKYDTLDEAETVLIKFMQELQPAFKIQHTTGKQIEKNQQQNKISIIDYWQDAANLDCKVKGWTDGATMAILYLKNISHVTVGKEDYFLNGTFLQ